MFDFYKWLNSPLGQTFQQNPQMGDVSYADAPSDIGTAMATNQYESIINPERDNVGKALASMFVLGSIGSLFNPTTAAVPGELGPATSEAAAETGGLTGLGNIMKGGKGIMDFMGGGNSPQTIPMPSINSGQYQQQVQFSNAPEDVAQAKTGVIPEPVVGVGQHTGKTYSFAEYAPEQVTKIPGTEQYFDNKVSAYGSNRSYANAPEVSKGNPDDVSEIFMRGIMSKLEEQTKEQSSAVKTLKNFMEDSKSVSKNELNEAVDKVAHGLMGSPWSPGGDHNYPSGNKTFPDFESPFAESYAQTEPIKGQVAMETAPSVNQSWIPETDFDPSVGSRILSGLGDIVTGAAQETVGLDRPTVKVGEKTMDAPMDWSDLGRLAIKGIKGYVDLSLLANGSAPLFQNAEKNKMKSASEDYYREAALAMQKERLKGDVKKDDADAYLKLLNSSNLAAEQDVKLASDNYFKNTDEALDPVTTSSYKDSLKKFYMGGEKGIKPILVFRNGKSTVLTEAAAKNWASIDALSKQQKDALKQGKNVTPEQVEFYNQYYKNTQRIN